MIAKPMETLMLIRYEPKDDSFRSYVEDKEGRLFFMHDFDDATLYRVASMSKKLIVRAAEIDAIPPEAERLAQRFYEFIYVNNQVEPARPMIHLPTLQELGSARLQLLMSEGLRLLGGFDQEANGDWILAICFVPRQICGCELVVKT